MAQFMLQTAGLSQQNGLCCQERNPEAADRIGGRQAMEESEWAIPHGGRQPRMASEIGLSPPWQQVARDGIRLQPDHGPRSAICPHKARNDRMAGSPSAML
mgnify:CR=1 FL=1